MLPKKYPSIYDVGKPHFQFGYYYDGPHFVRKDLELTNVAIILCRNAKFLNDV